MIGNERGADYAEQLEDPDLWPQAFSPKPPSILSSSSQAEAKGSGAPPEAKALTVAPAKNAAQSPPGRSRAERRPHMDHPEVMIYHIGTAKAIATTR